MTGVFYALVERCLSVLPVDAAGRRVFDETLADWRRERTNAKGAGAAALVTARSLWSVLRCVLMVSAREVRSREGMATLLRLAAWSIVSMLVFIGIRWNQSILVHGTPVPLGPVPGALLSVASVLGVMPFLAFLSAAIGRRLPVPAPRLGPAFAVGVVMFVALGWVMPATNQAFREFTFGLSSSGPIAPGINERSIVALVGMLFTESVRAAFGLNVRLVFVIAAPVMLVVGSTMRTLTGWRRVAGSVLPIPVLFLPALIGLNRYGEVAWWPVLLAVILVARALARGAEHDSADSAGSTVA